MFCLYPWVNTHLKKCLYPQIGTRRFHHYLFDSHTLTTYYGTVLATNINSISLHTTIYNRVTNSNIPSSLYSSVFNKLSKHILRGNNYTLSLTLYTHFYDNVFSSSNKPTLNKPFYLDLPSRLHIKTRQYPSFNHNIPDKIYISNRIIHITPHNKNRGNIYLAIL